MNNRERESRLDDCTFQAERFSLDNMSQVVAQARNDISACIRALSRIQTDAYDSAMRITDSENLLGEDVALCTKQGLAAFLRETREQAEGTRLSLQILVCDLGAILNSADESSQCPVRQAYLGGAQQMAGNAERAIHHALRHAEKQSLISTSWFLRSAYEHLEALALLIRPCNSVERSTLLREAFTSPAVIGTLRAIMASGPPCLASPSLQ